MLGIFNLSVLVPALMYDSETMLWKEKERSRIRDVQINNFIGLPWYWENG